jgi:hypothetical protein
MPAGSRRSGRQDAGAPHVRALYFGEPVLRKDQAKQLYAGDPRYRRWLNQCVACGRIGYKPELPARTTARLRLGAEFSDFPTGIGHTIRSTFEPLPVDSSGLCDVCRNVSSC